MLVWEKAEPENALRELALRNTDPFYNQVTEGKETLTPEELEEDRREGLDYGAERFLLRLDGEDGEDVGVFDHLLRHPHDGYPWIGFLFIAPPFRKRGLARAVLSEYFSRLRSQGHSVCQLGVVEGNSPGHRFWRSLGFEPVRTVNLKSGKSVDVYERTIDDDLMSSLVGRHDR